MTNLVNDGHTAFEQFFFAFPKLSFLLKKQLEDIFADEHKDIAEQAVGETLARLEFTARALHRKYAFTKQTVTGDEVSIAASGFFNRSEVDGIMIEMAKGQCTNAINEVIQGEKFRWLDRARRGDDDLNALWRIGQHLYLDMIYTGKAMMPVICDAPVELVSNEAGMRTYLFWWACYSTSNNAPAIHLMEFTQDENDPQGPIQEGNTAFEAFIQTIRRYGGRTPTISVLAHDIDSSLPAVHPKRLIRLGFEQLFTKQSDFKALALTGAEACIEDYFDSFAERDDIVVQMYYDTLISRGTSRDDTGVFETFERDGNGLAVHRGSTKSYEYWLLPHRFLQVANSTQGQVLTPLLNKPISRFAYTAKGEIHAV